MELFFTRTSRSGRTGERMILEERVKESSCQQMILLCTRSLSMDKILRSLPTSRIGMGSNLYIRTCPSSMSTTFQSMGADGFRLNLPIKRSLKRKITTKVSNWCFWCCYAELNLLINGKFHFSLRRDCDQYFEVSWCHSWGKVSRQHLSTHISHCLISNPTFSHSEPDTSMRLEQSFNYSSSKGLRERHSETDSWSGEFRSSSRLWKRPRKCLSLQESPSRIPLLLLSTTARSIWYECSFQGKMLQDHHRYCRLFFHNPTCILNQLFITLSSGQQVLLRLQWWISRTRPHATTSSRPHWE